LPLFSEREKKMVNPKYSYSLGDPGLNAEMLLLLPFKQAMTKFCLKALLLLGGNNQAAATRQRGEGLHIQVWAISCVGESQGLKEVFSTALE
jgi:hypothetical protein